MGAPLFNPWTEGSCASCEGGTPNGTICLLDGFEMIRRYADVEDAAFFVDPPYTAAAKRLYSHWAIDHAALFNTLAAVKGDFLLTYDNTREIRDLAGEFGFESETVSMKNTHHAKMTELIIGRDLSWLREASRSREVQTQIEL